MRDKKRIPRVTLFMPTLNEIDGARSIIPKLKKEWFDEVIVIDGGSIDGTIEYMTEQGFQVHHQELPGMVDAWNEGFKHSTGDIFILFTPDGNCLPELIPGLLQEINKGYDIVFVSRYLPPASSSDDGIVTGFGNWMFTKLINLTSGGSYTDTLGGFRAYTRDSIIRMNLHQQCDESWIRKKFNLVSSWEVGSCFRAAKLGLKTTDIPGDEPARIGGNSKMSPIRNGTAIIVQIILELISGNRHLITDKDRNCG